MPDRDYVRVLLAEDDPEIRCELAHLLELNGYHVQAVATGADLLEAVSSWVLSEAEDIPAELIVTDVRMPGVSGLSIVEGLRATGWSKPIIVMSAFADDDMAWRVSQLSGVALVPKPFDPATFEVLVDELSADYTDHCARAVTDR